MPSPPPIRPATPPLSTQTDDATSSTQQVGSKRPAPAFDADSPPKRPRLEPDLRCEEQADWHSQAWRTYAYGHEPRPPAPPRPGSITWGWPVP